MIIKEVLKTTVASGHHVDDSRREVSASVGTHNLTELRQKLEERMLLTVHSKNRTITAENQ